MEFCEIFARYGLDVALISIFCAALCAVLKRTALKNKPRAVTIVAYIFGTLVYAIYESVREGDALYAFENFSSVIEHGLSVGTLSVLLCIATDRFLGGGSATAQDAVAEILKGWVLSGKEKTCADRIISLAQTKDGDELKEAAKEAISEYIAEGLSDTEITLITALACEAAERLKTDEKKPESGETQTEET